MADDLLSFLNFKGLDLDNGKRNIDLKKDFKTAKDLGQEYGFDVALPSLGGLTVNQYAEQNRQSMIPEGKEVVKYKGKNVLVDKDRPKGYQRLRAGLADFFNLKDFYAGRGEQTDLDKMGGLATDKGYDPLGGLTEFDPKDLSKLQLNPSQQRLAGQRYQQETAVEKSPTDTLNDAIKAYSEFKKNADKESRKGRTLDSAMEFLNYTLTSPKIYEDLRREGDYVQNRLLQAEKFKQGLADPTQRRLVTADTGFKQTADAIAGQYLAAVEGAKAGAFPRNVSFSA